MIAIQDMKGVPYLGQTMRLSLALFYPSMEAQSLLTTGGL